MKRSRKAESVDKSATRKKSHREYMKRCHKAESIDIAAARQLTAKIKRDIDYLKVMMQLQHKEATTIHQTRENFMVSSIMLAQFATTRK
jgi:hypothetical protein